MKFSKLRRIRKRLRLEREAAVLQAYRRRGKQIVHFLHIGKTGGTALREALRKHTTCPHYFIALHKHDLKLSDVPFGEKTVFFLRDPIRSYVSGFMSRQRQGLPRYFSAWSPDEKRVFERFGTANELALSLSSEDEEIHVAAERAMRSIKHVRSSFWDWFGDRNYFRSRLGDILFVGFQERLDEDFNRLKSILGLPEDLCLPRDDVRAHKNPRNIDIHLEDTALRNLLTWYARDYQFLELCKEIVPIPDEVARSMELYHRLFAPRVS